MKQTLLTIAAVLGTALTFGPAANAGNIGSDLALFAKQSHTPELIKVHSPQRAHHMLHDYGFNRVVLISQRQGYDGYPVYKFRTCLGHKAFHVTVDWHGNIVHQHPAGECHHRHDY